MRNFLAGSLLLGGAVLSVQSLADPYTDMYVFGDSLADNGQFDGRRFTNRVGPDYQNSAFGPVQPSLVAESLKIRVAEPSEFGGTNYAVGGNRSIDTLNSITAPTTYDASSGNGTFNSLFYNLERSGQPFDKNAIYSLDGGGNDIGAGQVFDEASAGVVATNMVDAANALRERGAKYVVITNVPDFGLAPRGVPFSAFATTQAAEVNSQIQQQIGSDNILIFDAFTMLQEIAATPATFGVPLTTSEFSRACFDSTEEVCAQGNAAAKIEGTNPDPDQFFFNDPLHATTIGQQISADYLYSVLQAPGELALLPEMGMDDMQAHWRSSRPIMRSNRWSKLTEVGSYTVWGGLNGNEDERDTVYNDTGTNESIQYNVGVSYRPGDLWYVGAQVGRADNELDFDGSRSHYEMESLSFSLLAGYAVGNWFLETMVSYADLDYDKLERRFNLGPMLSRTEHADTSGETWGAWFNVGINVLDTGRRYRLGPMVGYEYVSTDVDGYEEKSSDTTALKVDDMDTSTGIISAGAFGDMQLEYCACKLYSELTYRYYTEDDATDPRIGLKSLAGNSAKLPGYSRDDDSWRWDIGLAAKLSETVELNLGGGINEANDSNGYWFGGELSYSF